MRRSFVLPMVWLGLAAAPAARADKLLFINPSNSNQTTVESVLWSSPQKDVEAGDDFTVTGTIERIVATASGCFSCAPPTVTGVHVRFYAMNGSVPGALLSHQFAQAGTPNLVYDPQDPADVEVRLPTPFQANGTYFVTLQMAFTGGGYWSRWASSYGNPQGIPALVKDNLAGGTWTVPSNIWGPQVTDLTLQLWGSDGGPPDFGNDPCGIWVETPVPPVPGSTHTILRDLDVRAIHDAWAVGAAQVPDGFGGIDSVPVAFHWDGQQWVQVPVPAPSPYPGGGYAGFNAVAAIGPNDVWAAGYQNAQAPDGFVGTHLLVMHWDGSSWSEVPTPMTIGGSGNIVSGIEVVAQNDIWFVGDWLKVSPSTAASKVALAMRWDGSSFTIYDTPFVHPVDGDALERVDAVSANDVWAVGGGHDGDYTAISYIIHFDGSSWSHVPGPAPGTFHRLWDVEAIAADDVWATGDYFVAGQGYFPLMLHWDGSSWTQVPTENGSRGLHAFASNEIYACGGGIARWDGATWSQVETFSEVNGPSTLDIDAAGACDSLMVVGRKNTALGLQAFAARLLPGSAWFDVGSALAGSAGKPKLSAKTTFEAGTPIRVDLVNAKPNAPTLFVLGASPANLPFFGGLLVPSPQVLLPLLNTNGAGEITLFTTWPATPSGVSLFLQAWTVDAGAPQGVAGSNAILGITP